MSSSSLEGNKIAASVLVAGIVAMLAGFVSGRAFQSHAPEEDAYPIAATASEAAPAAEAAPPLGRDEILALIASADAASGSRIAKKCVSCHVLEKGGANKIGPHLWDTVNRPIASIADFKYSKAFNERAGTLVWDYEALFHFLGKPRTYIKGTKMSFAGLSKEQDRADLIEYLRTLSDSPPPVE